MSRYVEKVHVDALGFCYALLRGIGWIFCGAERSQTACRAQKLLHFMATPSEIQA